MYAQAWRLLNERLEQKTSWGRVELRQLMLRCLIDTDMDVDHMAQSREGEIEQHRTENVSTDLPW